MLGAMGYVLAIEVSSTSMRDGILDRIVSFADFSGKKLTMTSRFLEPDRRLDIESWPISA
jgi:hypothetical protein